MWQDLHVAVIEEFVDASLFARRSRLRLPWGWRPEGKDKAAVYMARRLRLNAEARAMRPSVPPVTAAFPLITQVCPYCAKDVEMRPGCRMLTQHACHA